MSSHEQVYSLAEYYDIAFDFRNVPAECDFLWEVFLAHRQRAPKSFLELAAGPAYHAIELARRGARATALDLSAEMVAWGKGKARAAAVEVDYLKGDMTSFSSNAPSDLAVLLMDSASYLLTNEAFDEHLTCVASALSKDGIYVLEMSHPRDVFGVGKSATSAWTSERGGKRVSFTWGSAADSFDPISQITDVMVSLSFEDGVHRGEIVETARQRCFTYNEIRALVQANGRFSVRGFYGSMASDQPFNNESRAWRMVVVLAKN